MPRVVCDGAHTPQRLTWVSPMVETDGEGGDGLFPASTMQVVAELHTGRVGDQRIGREEDVGRFAF